MGWLHDVVDYLRAGSAHAELDLSDESFRARLERVSRMYSGGVSFWKRVVDWENGGFYGLVAFDGAPVKEAKKDLIQQARHLWTFSQVYRYEEPSEENAGICRHQYDFFKRCFWDAKRCTFHREVTADGQPLEGHIHHYPLSFCLFGLANYACAFPEEASGREALSIALTAFETICEKSWCDDSGFDETVYPGRWCPEGKEINTQMHLLEAVGELFEAVDIHQGSPRGLLDRVFRRQLDLHARKAIVERGGHWFCSAGYSREWELVNDRRVEFGHDIEVVYLVWHAASRLGLQDRDYIVEPLLGLAKSTSEAAFDRRLGRWYYSGNPLTGRPLEKVANLWTNFEALNGLMTAYRLSEDARYLRMFDRVLNWLDTRQSNPQTGEWFYNVDWRGRPLSAGVYGEDCAWMSFPWKSSYHSLRALIACREWLKKRANPSPAQTPGR